MRSSKITTALAVTALVVAVLGTTPLGHAAGSILPRNSVGTPQIKKGAVNSTKIHANSITGSKVVDGSITAADLKPGTIPAGGTPAKVPAARVTRGSSNQTINNNYVTPVAFDSEVFDTAGLFDPASPNALKAPVSGLYLVTASVRWEANGSGTRFAGFTRTGGTGGWLAPDWRNATAGEITDQEISTLLNLNAGDIVHLRVYQTSGGPLDLLWKGDPDSSAEAPTMTMHYVGPAS